MAFSQKTMDTYRQVLAQQLQHAAIDFSNALVDAGWEHDSVQNYMGNMAASAVLAKRGNSGDAVRIVTALAGEIHGGSLNELDETTFWRERSSKPKIVDSLDPDTVVALVKCFVLEWSIDFDYQMYH